MQNVVKRLVNHNFRLFKFEFRTIMPVVLAILVVVAISISYAFRKPTMVDLRSFAPQETLIYLESNSLGKSLRALTENESFRENSSVGKDLSVIDGIQIAVAVTGFKANEKKDASGQSTLNLKPEFVVIAETRAWSWQINSIVENNINSFVQRVYGDGVKFSKVKKNGEKWHIWTARDGRKTFAVISDTQIFFGNSEDGINKCLFAKSSNNDLRKNESLSYERENAVDSLAFGFISTEGVKRIADLVGVTVAIEKSEDEAARGFISSVLPQILNNTTKEIIWVAEKGAKGIEDKITIKTKDEVSGILNETLVSVNSRGSNIYGLLPGDAVSVTRYNLKNPQLAFRGLLLVVAEKTDLVTRRLLGAFSNSLLEPYGISDAEAFLSGVDSEILTAQFDDDGERSLVIVKPKDLAKIKQSITDKIDFSAQPEMRSGAEIWQASDKILTVALVKDVLILGDSESVNKSLSMNLKSQRDNELTGSHFFRDMQLSSAVSATIKKDTETTQRVLKVLGKPKSNAKGKTSYSLVETRFNKLGVERKYISDFGLIGTILELFSVE